MLTEHDIIQQIIEREGGFNDVQGDHGGATNYGITIQTLAKWRKRAVSVADVRDMTKVEAAQIYRERYVVEPGFSGILNPELRSLVVDCGVNHGPDDATRWAQQAVGGLKVDGWFGPKTRKALEKCDVLAVYLEIVALRISYYGQLVTKNPSDNAQFAHGWNNRAASFVRSAPLNARA